MNVSASNGETIKHHLIQIPLARVASLWVVTVLVCGLALMPMWSLARDFSSDWYNHLWLMEYAGYHLWLTGTAPEVLNTPQAVGMPMLLFYGQKFYTALGAFSFVLGSALTLRLAVLAVLLLQFGHVHRAARATGVPASLCLAVPVLVTWQVFQATTLYERGDVPEYFAIALLTICVANLFVLAVRTARGASDPYGFWTTGLYYGLAALTHPLTAVYGGAFVALAGLGVLLVVRGRQLWRFAAFNLAVLSLLLAPWLWVALRYAKQTNVVNAGSTAELFMNFFASDPVATLLRAFSPTSFNAYSTRVFLQQAPGEFNIQTSLPLLVLAVVLIVVFRRFPLRDTKVVLVAGTLLAVAFGTFGISLLVYCSPGVSILLGHAFDALQFPYRLGAYVNLALLQGVLALLGLTDWQLVRAAISRSSFGPTVAVALITLSAVGWFSKCGFIELKHNYREGTAGLESLLRQRNWALRNTGYWVPGSSNQDGVHLIDLPATGYFQSDYDIRTGLRDSHELSPSMRMLAIPFELGDSFGSPLPRDVTFAQRTLVLTNVNPFPWNEVILDGTPVSRHDVFALNSPYGIQFFHPRAYALFMEPGEHTLSYRFSPDPTWRWLNVISWLALVAWFAASVGAAASRFRHLPWVRTSTRATQFTKADGIAGNSEAGTERSGGAIPNNRPPQIAAPDTSQCSEI